MTSLDRNEIHSGYWPSPWPVECGGNRRQKSASGGINAAEATARVVSRRDGQWHVMVVEREPGQWYVGGTMPAFSGPPPYGWVERLDPETLEATVRSPNLPCGDHVWCGAILAHANGSIHSVNGSFLHRLDADTLEVLAERELPADRSHNGLLALSDGTLITKDLQLEGQEGTTLTRLDPESLQLVGEPIVLPEGSMGRIAADAQADGSDLLYVPGIETVMRLRIDGDDIALDDWRPRYRDVRSQQGLAWDACLSGDACWIMDCGDIHSVRNIHLRNPNGRFETAPGAVLSWRQPAPWTGPQRLLRLDLHDAENVMATAPFGVPGGGIIAPPVHVPDHDIAVAWDSVNGGLAGVTTSGGDLDVAWTLADVRPSMQPVVFPETGELVINDFTDQGSDDIIVVDVSSGELLDRVSTGSRIANGMFLTAGGSRDVFYCSTTHLARIIWES